MTTLEQIGLERTPDGLYFAASHFDTMHKIYALCEKKSMLYGIARGYEDSIDLIPEMLPESHPRYDEVEREICDTADALEGDFITALENYFLSVEA